MTGWRHLGQRVRSRAALSAPLLLGIALIGAGCSSPGDTESGPVDRSSLLVGTDVDGNGVRDDIDRAIAAWPVSREVRGYLTERARIEQSIMELDTAAPAAKDRAYDIASAVHRLIACVPEGIDYEDALNRAEDIEELTANTAGRRSQVRKFTELIDGRSFPAPNC